MTSVPVAGKPWGLSVKVVIRNDDGHCLILKRSMSSRTNPGKWELPGGKISTGENFAEALAREVKEETGLEISIQHAIGTAEYELPTVKVVLLIMEGHKESGQILLSSEHDEHIWIERRKLVTIDLADWLKQFAQERGWSERP